MKDSLGDRMKRNYEDVNRTYLTRRVPVILRLDGRAFHTLTRKCEKPFDKGFHDTMELTGLLLCAEIQGGRCAYIQSDEISILITDYEKLTSEAWFGYNVQKMVSIAAAFASVNFTTSYGEPGLFDARAFNLPKEEVCNYFIWRQKDWIRNSVQMLAQKFFSHKQLQGKNQAQLHEMLHDIGINWADLDDQWKNGTFIDNTGGGFRVSADVIFTQTREAIDCQVFRGE